MTKETSSSRPVRIFITSLAILLLVLIILGAAGVYILQTQWFLNWAEDKMTASIGQEVNIGSLDLDPGQPFFVRVENVSVANPSWASTPALASVDVFKAGIDIIELFSGDLVFTEVRVVEPIVHLERISDGRANWTTIKKNSANDGQTSDDTDSAGTAPDLPRIEALVVKDGRFTYNDPTQNTSMNLSIKSRVGAKPAGTGLTVKGSGTVLGQPLQVALRAGAPPELTATDAEYLPLTIELNSAEARLFIEGKIDALISPETANLQITMTGQELSRWNEALKMELPALPHYELTGHLLLEDGVWALKPVTFTVGNSGIKGTLQMVPDANPLRIEGDFYSQQLDVPQIQSYLPDKPEIPLAVQAATFLNFLDTRNWQAELQYHADFIKTGIVPVHHADIAVTFKERILDIKKLSGAAAGLHMSTTGKISVDQKPAEGLIQMQFETANASQTTASTNGRRTASPVFSELPGNLTGELAVQVRAKTVPVEGKTAPVGSHHPAQRVELTSIDIPNFLIRYTDPATDTHILTRLNEEKLEEALIIQAEGQYHDKPTQASLRIPGLELLTNPDLNMDRPQRIAADLHIPGTTASVEATVPPAWPPASMNVQFWAESEKPATTAALWGFDLPELDRATVKGSLIKRNSLWTLNEFSSRFGKSSLQGTAKIHTADEVRFEAKLQSEVLDVASLIPPMGVEHSSSDSASSDDQPSNGSTNIPSAISLPQWLTDLSGKIGLEVKRLVVPKTTFQDLTILAAIDDGRLRLTPLSLKIGGGLITTTAMLDLNAPGLAGSLQTDIKEVDLKKAMQETDREAVELGTVNGLIALQLPAGDRTMTNSFTTGQLLDRVRIENIRLRYDDPAIQAKTDLRLTADSVTSGINITGTIEYQDTPVDVAISTGSLRQAFSDHKSMPVNALLKIQETILGMDGTIGHLLSLENFSAAVSLQGPNPAPLGKSFKIPLPHLPPYRFQTQLHGEQGPEGHQTFVLKDLDGTIGDSDISGTLQATIGGERPEITGRLHSAKLDLDELAEVQPEKTEAEKKSKSLLPDDPIDFTKLRKIDADIEYRAKRIQYSKIPLDDIRLNMMVKDGHLRINPLDFEIGGGTVLVELEVLAGEDPVQARFITDLNQINLRDLIARFEMADDAVGDIGGRAVLWMRGESLAQWLASADGGVYVTMTGGQLDALLLELAGLDFVESAAVLLGTESAVPIDCAYMDLQVRSGMLTIDPLLFDTKDTKLKGSGTIDLGHEQVDVTVRPYPKDFSLLSSRGPLHVTGTFKKPSFGVEPSFPSPEFGTADTDVRCLGMIEALETARKKKKNEPQKPLTPEE